MIEIVLNTKIFSDIWNHDRHFIIILKNAVELHKTIVLKEESTYRTMLCAVSFIDNYSEGLLNNYAAASLEILYTSSEYANHYGNCSLLHEKYRSKK